MDCTSRRGFIIVIQLESCLKDSFLTGYQGPDAFDQFAQLSSKTQPLALGQNPKQDMVHLGLGLTVYQGSFLGVVPDSIGLGQQCDGLGHLVVHQEVGAFLHKLQIAVERQIAHLVLFQLLKMLLQNALEQFLHEPARTLLVVSLARDKPGVTTGGLGRRRCRQQRHHA